ncbi:MAG: hypothetical protein KJO32_07245 [Deltaproteobacteria bacterium]|nr:hypothetical protein [Deltaproteobacteria bacterium]
MKVKCPHCGVSGKVDNTLSGSKVKCPQCKDIFLIPSVDSSIRLSEQQAEPSSYQQTSHFSESAAQYGRGDTSNNAEDDASAGTDSVDLPVPDSSEQIEKELQAELDAMLAETCSVCGKGTGDELTFLLNHGLYCQDCQPQDQDQGTKAEPNQEEISAATLISVKTDDNEVNEQTNTIPVFSLPDRLSMGALLKESWIMTRGLKSSIWGGVGIMVIILAGLTAATTYLIAPFGDPTVGMLGAWLNIGSQCVSTILSMIFVAGLMYIALRRVAGKNYSWKMIFSGFGHLGQIIVASVLMSLLIVIGFLLLILPGIYLTIGYSLTLPLILDKGLGPWAAMEASRRVIHQKWWQVFGLYVVMYVIYFISCIPLGLGMIWTIPMFFALTGVLYHVLTPAISEEPLS